MTTFCLLVFSSNSNEEVLRLFRRLRDKVDEFVVVDSSTDMNYQNLTEALGNSARIYRTLPLGITDLYRQYATSKIKSDFVLNLDCDEDISNQFMNDFKKFDTAEAYIVGWHHVMLREQAKKLVLYRNNFVRWIGHVFENPSVTGKIEDISNTYQILHYAKFDSNYGTDHGRYRRYLFYESICRPFTWKCLTRDLNLKLWPAEFGSQANTKLLRPFFVWRLIFYMAYLERIVRNPKQKGIARFLLNYGKARLSYFSNLTLEQQELFVSISNKVYENGGLTRFLALDDPTYVDRLTSTFDWSMDSVEAARKLIMYRFLEGVPLPSFDEFHYKETEVNDFWGGRFQLAADSGRERDAWGKRSPDQ